MSDLANIVVGIIALNGGRIVGKTRLQKTFYLLNACGLNTGVEFDYYKYGPFSSELAQTVDEAYAEKRIEIEEGVGRYRVPYKIFSTAEAAPESIGNLDADKVRKILKILDPYSALELEVAATIHYLKENGYGDEAVKEAKTRKPLKADQRRVEKALQAMGTIGLNGRKQIRQ